MAFHSVSWELSPLSALHRDFIYFYSYCCNLWRLLETFEWRFFFKILFPRSVGTYYKRTQKVKKFKMSLVLLGFLLKVERVSGCELLLQQPFQKKATRHPKPLKKKKCSSQFFLLNRIHPTWTKFNFLLLLFLRFFSLHLYNTGENG